MVSWGAATVLMPFRNEEKCDTYRMTRLLQISKTTVSDVTQDEEGSLVLRL